MSDQVRVNGNLIGWGSLRTKMDAELLSGITSIDHGDSVEKTLAYGQGKHYAPRGRTRGKYVPKPLVLEVYKATAREIRRYLASKAGTRGISDVPVNFNIQYIEPDDGETVTIEALEATLTENDGTDTESPDPSKEKITFLPLRYKRNGIALYDTSEAGA